MKLNEKKFYAIGILSLIATDISGDANSRSIRYNIIRDSIPELKKYSNNEIDELMKNTSFVLAVEPYGTDEQIFGDDAIDDFENGNFSKDEGICISIGDYFFYSDYDTFKECESNYYDNDELLEQVKPYFQNFKEVEILKDSSKINDNELLELLTSIDNEVIEERIYKCYWDKRIAGKLNSAFNVLSA